jgi:hypothetical protein
MTTRFPAALDILTNPSTTDNLNTPEVLHSTQHSTENDAIEALEAKVGITNSEDTSSLDYKANRAAVCRQVEIDFGATPILEKDFTITDAGVVAASIITMQLAYVAPTGKDLDELEFDSFDFRCAPGSGTFTLHARALEGLVADKFKVNYSYNQV